MKRIKVVINNKEDRNNSNGMKRIKVVINNKEDNVKTLFIEL